MNDMLETTVKPGNYPAYEKIIKRQRPMPHRAFDIEGLCADLDGLDLQPPDNLLGDKIAGMIVKDDSGRFSIYVNGSQPLTRQRFTIAHEVAHFLLHKEKLGDKFPENILLRGGLSNKEETEANKLAAEMLMPYEAIDGYIRQNDGSFTIRKLAAAFMVSPSAMAIRLGIPID